MKKLFEIRGDVSYAIVIAAETEEEALKHVETWEHAWDANADLLGASAEIADTRIPASQELEDLEADAHEVL